MTKPALAVLGPTASGKSDLAIELALRFDGEVVNCDSVQVYKGLDGGSAKVPEDERRGVPHHMLDVIDPREHCTAGDYARMARPVLREIADRRKIPVVAGGTGCYFRSLTEGLFQGPRRDEDLRARLEVTQKRHGVSYLHRLLTRLDPKSAGRIHANDLPKVTRALEIRILGNELLAQGFERGRDSLEGFRFMKFALNPPREELYDRIDARASVLFDRGLVHEVRSLIESGVPTESWALGSHGYAQAVKLIHNEMTLEDAIESTALVTRQYSKRQRTWFTRQESNVVWLEGFGTNPAIIDDAARQVSGWLESTPTPSC